MGNTESAVPEMEDHPDTAPEVPAPQGGPRRRRRRHTTSGATDLRRSSTYTFNDDPWWWEVENENLILDQVPNVTQVYGVGERRNESVQIVTDSENVKQDCETERNDCAAAKTTCEIVESDVPLKPNAEASANTKIETLQIDLTAGAAVVPIPELEKTATETPPDSLSSKREQTLEEFKEELRLKRLARQNAVQDLRDEITTLRQQLTAEQALTQRLRQGAPVTADEVDCAQPEKLADEGPGACALDSHTEFDADDEDPLSRSRHANIELANAQLALQLANSENLSLRTELGVVQKQVGTLKEVIACCKQMLAVKEEQCDQLKDKLKEIETSFAEREMRIMSNNLRQEYERQLGNIRQLRQLYEERQRVSAAEHENLQRLISIKKDELLAEQEKTKNFEDRNQNLIKEVEAANDELAALRDECNEHKFEKRTLKEEMGAVNTLFCQMVMGFNGKNNLDIDRLTEMLEENRTLLNDMATKEANCSDGATLPKLLFELVEQASVAGKGSGCVTPLLSASEGEEEAEDVEDDVQKGATNDNEELAQAVQNVCPLPTDKTEAAMPAAAELPAEAVAADVTTQEASSKYYHCQRKNATGNNKVEMLPTHTADCAEDAAGAELLKGAIPKTLKLSDSENIVQVASAQEIIGNLPKVWKVLMELLSHHTIEQVQFEEYGNAEDCYKSVQTPNGPKAELSVSKTYIKLKDLILEKKSLVKETNRLKTLNCHLEYRLNEQEKRLSAVSLELTKTWHLVGKMQRQHRQLHTQEQILRYQLQQKRRLLSELKDELEYCRRKWAAARAKNDESQAQWNDLRREFAKRKLDDANHSAESGYSDSGPGSDEEERAGAATAAVAVAAAALGTAPLEVAVGASACSRRKHFREMFEHTRKIKRMQSTSPGRALGERNGDEHETAGVELVLRWNSAPPTCGWRRMGEGGREKERFVGLSARLPAAKHAGAGAVPKAHCSRSKKRVVAGVEEQTDASTSSEATDSAGGVERASRIQRLEEQCKSLIQQVLETSDNRERLEVQLCRFQDAIAPVQYAVPLDKFIMRRRMERMTRASSAPATGNLTQREEEYTRKRSERLERLEEESRQLMSRIKRTSDRGHYLRCSLDRLRRAPSGEGSCESNTEDESSTSVEKAKAETEPLQKSPKEEDTEENSEVARESQEFQGEKPEENDSEKSPLTAEEEAFTARRAARLERLEQQSRQLLSTLSRNTQRGDALGTRLDTLHERFGSEDNNLVEQVSVEQRLEEIDRVSRERNERLLQLEEEGNELLTRLSNTSERGTRMINRIAERALQRQARLSATPSREVDTEPAAECEGTIVLPESATLEPAGNVTADETPFAAAELLLPLKNVACSSIVAEQLEDCVTVTTTPSQIAEQQQQQQQGAVPKSKPVAQLCAARTKVERRTAPSTLSDAAEHGRKAEAETLEDMVRRLRQLPYPSEEVKDEQTQNVEATTSQKEDQDEEGEGEEEESVEAAAEEHT